MDNKTKNIIKTWLKHLNDTAIATATVKNEGSNSLVMLPGSSLEDDKLRLTPAEVLVIRENLLKQETTTDESHPICLLFPFSASKGNKGKTEFSACVAYLIEGELRQELADPAKERNWSIPLDVNDPSKTKVLTPNCLKLLEIDEETAEKSRTQEGLRNFVASLTGADNAVTFHQVVESLNGFALKTQKRVNSIESRYLLLARLDLSKYEVNLQKDLEGILETETGLIKGSPACKYLYADKDPHMKPVVNNHSIWMGQGIPYSYGIGQAEVLQRLQNPDDNLIAVQGPPGTGKTALIIGIIADQICRRAYAIATGSNDYDNLMLVTSDTNAAVDNVIEGLLAAVGSESKWFWINGGNKEKTDKEMSERVATFTEWLKDTPLDLPEYKKAAARVKQIGEAILLPIEQSKKQREQLTDWVKIATENIASLKKEKTATVAVIEKSKTELDSMPKLPNTFDSSVASDLRYEASLAKMQIQTLREAFSQSIEEAHNLATKNSGGLLAKMVQMFGNKNKQSKTASSNNVCVLTEREVELFREFRTKTLVNQNLIVGKDSSSPVTVEGLDSLITKIDRMVDQKNVNDSLLESLLVSQSKLEKTENEIEFKEKELAAATARLENWPDCTETIRTGIEQINAQHQLFRAAIHFLKLEALRNASRLVPVLEQYCGDSRQRIEVIHDDEKRRMLSLAYPVLASTSLSVRNLLPANGQGPEQGVLNICIVDESGMIPLHKVFPAIWRARKAVVVGDLKQLSPVNQLTDQQVDAFHKDMRMAGFSDNEIGVWSPFKATAYHRSAGCPADAGTMTGYASFLDEHRRCADNIAETFKSIARYDQMAIHTPDRSALLSEKTLRVLFGNAKIVGINIVDSDTKNGEKTENGKEAAAVVARVGALISAGIDPSEIGVVTPFRKQANRLASLLRGVLPQAYAQVGTVHTFQGKEFTVIIISTVIGEGAQNAGFADKMNLMNVAVSRAKQQIILVGDHKALLRKGRNLRILAEHASWGQLINSQHDLNAAHCPVNGRADFGEEPNVRRV